MYLNDKVYMLGTKCELVFLSRHFVLQVLLKTYFTLLGGHFQKTTTKKKNHVNPGCSMFLSS